MLKNIYKFGLMCLAVAIAACTPETPTSPYFTIEEGQMNYSVGYEKVAKADSRTFTVRSNKSWEIVGVDQYDWLKPFPSRGEGDGRFYFVIDENITLEEREAVYTLVIDGKEYPTAITVTQATRGEFVEVSQKSFTVLAAESKVGLKVKTNVDVNYRVISDNSGANGSWISFPKTAEMDPDSLYIKVTESTQKPPRTAMIAIYMEGKNTVADTVTLMQIGNQELYGFPAKWTFKGKQNDERFITGWQTLNSVPSDEGLGSFKFVTVEPTNDKYVRTVGSTGDPYLNGAWPGDYWLYEVPAIIPANTMFQITFAGRVSDTGHKFWCLEYLDGTEWLPVGTLLTTSEPGTGVSYTHTMQNVDQTISGSFKVRNPMTTLQIRYRCAANWTAGNATTPSAALSARNGGSARMTGRTDVPLEIKILDTNAGDEAVLEMSAYHVALEGAAGSQGSIKIKSSESWTLTTTATWFEISQTQGNANVQATVTVKANSANTTGSLRKANITLKSGLTTKTIEVIQGSAGGGSTEPDTPSEPEQPSEDLHVEWLFSAAAMSAYSGTFAETPPVTAAGDGGRVVNSNVSGYHGSGTIKYYQVDKSSLNILNEEAPSRNVGTSGHPFVYGAWPGDYWLFEITDGKEYPAGTKLNITFITRVSATGQKYWKLEYWDGQEWKPTEALKSVEINGATVQYNFTPTKETSNTKVDFTWTLAKACTTMKFRYSCVANCAYDGVAYDGLNKGTCRIAGAAGTSPVFKVVK